MTRMRTDLIKQQEYSIPIRQYFEIVMKKLDVYAVLLFGSVAKGDAKPFRSYESDIDIIVIIKDFLLTLKKECSINWMLNQEQD